MQVSPNLLPFTMTKNSGKYLHQFFPQLRRLGLLSILVFLLWRWKVKVKSLSHVRLLVTSWTAAYQAPLFTGFSRQEYWSGVPLPPLVRLCTKSFNLGFSSTWTENFQMYKLYLEYAEEPRSNFQNSLNHKAREFQKTSISVSLTMVKPLTADYNKLENS